MKKTEANKSSEYVQFQDSAVNGIIFKWLNYLFNSYIKGQKSISTPTF